MGDPRNSISSTISRFQNWFLEQPPLAVPKTEATEPAPAQERILPLKAGAAPKLSGDLGRDARWFVENPFTGQSFSFDSPLSQELKDIYRTVAVKGERAPLPPAAEARDHRNHVLRLWGEYQQSRLVLQEGGAEQVDGHHLKTATDLLQQLSDKMPELAPEEALELGVHLTQEMKFLRPLEAAHKKVLATVDPEVVEMVSETSVQSTAALGENLQATLEKITDPKRAYLAMAAYQELRQGYSTEELATSEKTFPDFQTAMVSISEQRAAAKAQFLAVEKEISRMAPGTERMVLKVQILNGLYALGMDTEAAAKLKSWSQSAAQSKASPEWFQESLGITAFLMEREAALPVSGDSTQSTQAMSTAFKMWEGLSPEEQVAFAPTLNDFYLQMRREGLDPKGQGYLERMQLGSRLDKLAADENFAWSPSQQIQMAAEQARATGDLASLELVYDLHWLELGGNERLELRSAHARVLLELKERHGSNAEKTQELEQAAFVLAESWRLTVTQKQLQAEGEELDADAATMLELENLTELVKFSHQFGEGIHTRGGRVSLDTLGNAQNPEDSQAPLHLLERSLEQVGAADRAAAKEIADPEARALALAKVNIEQNQLGGFIGAQLVETWPYASIELLSKCPNVDLSGLNESDRETLLKDTQWLKAQLGMVSLYDRAKTLLSEEISDLLSEQGRLENLGDIKDKELSSLMAQEWSGPEVMDERLRHIPFEINNAQWAMNSAKLWSVEAAEQVATYSTGDMKTVAQAMTHYQAGRHEDAVVLFQALMEKEALDSPDAQMILDSLGKNLLQINQGRFDRQIHLLKAFARAADYPSAADYQAAAQAGRRGRYQRQVDRGLAELTAYLRTLPPEQAPTKLTVAIHNYLQIHPESEAVKKLSEFIYQGPKSQLKHQREISSILNGMDNLDSSEDAMTALDELQVLLDKDVDYWEGEGEMMMAIYHAAAQVQGTLPLGSEAARKVRYFESRIQTEEMSGQFYRELFSKENAVMLALTFVGAGVAAKAGQWAARAMRTRLAAQTAIGGVMSAAELEAVAAEMVTMGRAASIAEGEMFLASRGLVAEVTTVDLASMGISQGWKVALLPEVANVGANASTFWAFNHLTQPGAQHHSLAATAIDVGVIHYAMQPFHSWGHLEGMVMRILGGASAMSAAGVLRTEVHELFPELHLAHDGEDPLSVYSFIHNVAFGAGMEAGGAGMGRARGMKGMSGIKGSKARQKNIQKLRGELEAIGLKIEQDAAGNLNAHGEIFLTLASGHFKNQAFSMGRFIQLMKAKQYGKASGYLRENGVPLYVSRDGKIEKSSAPKEQVSDAELAQLKQEIPRQILDVINDELAEVGLSFVDVEGKLTENAPIFIDLVKHHMKNRSGFSFGEFVSILKQDGGHVASQYLSKHKVPYWVSPDGKLRARGRRLESDFARDTLAELSEVLEELGDMPADLTLEFDPPASSQERTSTFVEAETGIWSSKRPFALRQIQGEFLWLLKDQEHAVNDKNYSSEVDPHEEATFREANGAKPEPEFQSDPVTPVREISAPRVKLEDSTGTRPDGPQEPVSPPASHLIPDGTVRLERPASVPEERTANDADVYSSSKIAAGAQRRSLEHSARSPNPTAFTKLSKAETEFRIRQAKLQIKPLEDFIVPWLADESSILPGNRHSSIKMNVESGEAEGGYPYLEMTLTVKGEHRAAAIREELLSTFGSLVVTGNEAGRETMELRPIFGEPAMIRVNFVTEKLPYDRAKADAFYQMFQKYYQPTLGVWFRGNGTKANYANRTYIILDRFNHLWEKPDLTPMEQDAMMNLVEYLKDVPLMIGQLDVTGRLHAAEQVALRVGPEAYGRLQDLHDQVLDLFGRVNHEISADELATGKVHSENTVVFEKYRQALRALDAEITALEQLPTGEGEILLASADRATSFLNFTQQEAQILRELGVDGVERILHDQGTGAKRFALAYGLNHLLRLSTARQDPRVDWGILRLTGALRQQLALGNQPQHTLDRLLARYHRDAIGMPLGGTNGPSGGSQYFVLSGSQRRVLSGQFPMGEVPQTVDPSNVLEVILAIHQLARKGGNGVQGQQALRLKSVGQELLKQIAEGYGPLIRQFHPELYQYYLNLNRTQGVGFDSGVYRGRGLAGAWARFRDMLQSEPDGPLVTLPFVKGQLQYDLKSLAGKRPDGSGRIEHLTTQLDQRFERGAVVTKQQGRYLLLEPQASGAPAARPVSAETYTAYLAWRNWRGFAPVKSEQANGSLEELKGGLNTFGIEVELTHPETFSPEQRGGVVYLAELLKELPANLYQSPFLKRIVIGEVPQGKSSDAHYDANTGTVYLAPGAFQGSRRNFSALVLHELGHGVSEMYLRPESTLSFQVKQQMIEAHRTITQARAHLGLDVLSGAENRANYQRSPQEFLAEVTMMYRGAGPKLRQHIADLPPGSAERQAWDWVYNQMQHHVFGGKEYGETRLQYAEVKGIAWDHAEQTREGGFQSQAPTQFFGSFAAWTDPSFYYKTDETGRPVNEDAIAQFRDGAIVADGMGGHGGGDKASAIVVEEFVNHVSKGGAMDGGFERAAQAVHDFNGKHGRSGAVAVAMRVLPQEGATDKLEVVHAGDAKLVVFIPDGQGGFKVQSRTIDHGLQYAAQKQGKRSTLEIRIDPNANVVASTLGGNMDRPTIEHQYMDLPEGARVVMGSDGLWDNVSSHEVAEVLSRHVTPDGALAELKQILDWKMDQLDRAKNLLRAGQGHSMEAQVMSKYTGELEIQTVKVVEIPDAPGFFISRSGDVYDAQGQVVDHYKFDNRALYVYHHDIPQ